MRHSSWISCCSDLRNMSKAPDSILRRLKVRRQKQRTILAMRWRCAKGGKEFKELDTFYRAIRPYLCVAQLFGIMPLSNVLSRDPQDVKFRLRSVGMCFTGLFLLLGGIKTVMQANILFRTGLNAKNMMNLVFLIVGIVNWLNFTGFARSWSKLILPWSSLDILMQFAPYAPSKHSLRSKLRLIGCVVGSLAWITCCTMPLATTAITCTSFTATRITRVCRSDPIWRRNSQKPSSCCPTTCSPFAMALYGSLFY
ncbi:gustatory receptor for sugar taste 61a isoform X5 [Drosophila pseudoobscura]|uniref:Gustatory receptor for sugar taste 61a isoform X5 n=1 Tax=Drosophila pseudoobscura pseudoobscura TaxID=46245 RepID=A0A6I8WES7_DROPS|nr:gustatory receptor for sugar taste 61a isoform X5 [Drosophila pseudoobscura]